jgi:hypothetical protein
MSPVPEVPAVSPSAFFSSGDERHKSAQA